jgi:hypothetical protein
MAAGYGTVSAKCTRSQYARAATAEQKAQVFALAKDLPRLWHAPTTQANDRKRMLRLLIEDITVEQPSDPKQLVVHIRWQGNASTNLTLQLPPNIADYMRCTSAVIDRVRELARSLTDAEIAEQFRRDGFVGAKGKTFSKSIIRELRFTYRIPPPIMRKPEELTVHQVAKRFGLSEHVVYYSIERGHVQASQLNRRISIEDSCLGGLGRLCCRGRCR